MFIITLFVGLLIMAPLMVIVWARSEVVTTGYRISELLKEREKLREVNIRLRQEINSLTSPQRLRRIATEKGFQRAGRGRIIVIVEEGD